MKKKSLLSSLSSLTLCFLFIFFWTTLSPTNASAQALGGALDLSFRATGWVMTDFTSLGFSKEMDQINALLLLPDGKILVGGSTRQGENNIFALARYCANGGLDNGKDDEAHCGGTGFGTDGLVALDVKEGADSVLYALGLQGEKIIAAGRAGDAFALARLCYDGTPDNGSHCGSQGFGTQNNGVVVEEINEGLPSEIRALKVQSNGKILVGGSVGSGDGQIMIIARFCADGALHNHQNQDRCSDDKDVFGVSSLGYSFLGSNGQGNSVRDLALISQEAGSKILVGGSQATQEGSSFVLIRLCSNGMLDNGTKCGPSLFGSTYPQGQGQLGIGGVVTSLGMRAASLNALVIGPDQKIVAVGEGDLGNPLSGVVARFCPDGALDAEEACGPGFGDTKQGVYIFKNGQAKQLKAVGIQADGKIIAAGNWFDPVSSLQNFSIVRLCANGMLDNGKNCGEPGFGTEGVARIVFAEGKDSSASALGIQPQDGKIVVGGFAERPNRSDHDFALSRLYGMVGDLSLLQSTDKPNNTSVFNSPILHTMTIKNEGPDTVMDVTLSTNPLPKTLGMPAGKAGEKVCQVIDLPPPEEGKSVKAQAMSYQVCNLGNIKKGDQIQVQTSLSSAEVQAFELKASLTQVGSFDPNPTNNTSSLSITFLEPSVEDKPTDEGKDPSIPQGPTSSSDANSGGGGGCAMTSVSIPSSQGLMGLVFLTGLYRRLRRTARKIDLI